RGGPGLRYPFAVDVSLDCAGLLDEPRRRRSRGSEAQLHVAADDPRPIGNGPLRADGLQAELGRCIVERLQAGVMLMTARLDRNLRLPLARRDGVEEPALAIAKRDDRVFG